MKVSLVQASEKSLRAHFKHLLSVTQEKTVAQRDCQFRSLNECSIQHFLNRIAYYVPR